MQNGQVPPKYPVSVYEGAVSIRNKWGSLTTHEEVVAARLALGRESDELPDIGPEHFETLEDYHEWVMEGAQRFMAS
jgi:hypothetical protein